MILHLDMKGGEDIQIKFDNGSLIQICIIVFVMKKIVRCKVKTFQGTKRSMLNIILVQ